MSLRELFYGIAHILSLTVLGAVARANVSIPFLLKFLRGAGELFKKSSLARPFFKYPNSRRIWRFVR
jgi:hypothetical protein